MRRSTKTTAISRAQRLRLCGETACDERTIAGVYQGRRVHSATYERVLRAALHLGLPVPPVPLSASGEVRATG